MPEIIELQLTKSQHSIESTCSSIKIPLAISIDRHKSYRKRPIKYKVEIYYSDGTAEETMLEAIEIWDKYAAILIKKDYNYFKEKLKKLTPRSNNKSPK